MRPAVYQPEIKPDQVHRLWLLKQQTGQPMTAMIREAVATYLEEHPVHLYEIGGSGRTRA